MANIIKRRDKGEVQFITQVGALFSSVNEAEGIWEAYSAVWGLAPYAKQPAILAPTVFTKSLQEQGTEIPIYFDHKQNPRFPFPIAFNLANWADDTGLRYKGQIDSEDGDAVDVFGKILRKVLKQNSVGFLPIKVVSDKATGLPRITEAYLDHHSVVTKAANPKALVIDAFSAMGLIDKDDTELIESVDFESRIEKIVRKQLEALLPKEPLKDTLIEEGAAGTVEPRPLLHSTKSILATLNSISELFNGERKR